MMRPSKDLSDMIKYMKLTGVWFYSRQEGSLYYFQILRMVLFDVIVFLWIISTSLSGFQEFLAKSFAGIIVGCSCLTFQWFSIFFNQRYLHQFVEVIREIFLENDSPKVSKIFYSLLKPTWMYAMFFSIYCTGIIFILFFMPVFYDTFATLFGFEGLVNIGSPLQGLISDKGSPFYWCLTWFNMVCHFSGTCFMAGILSCLVLSVSYVIAAMRSLCLDIEKLAETNGHKESILFRKIIKDHCRILKLHHLMNNFLGFSSFIHYVVSTITLTVFLFSMLKQNENATLRMQCFHNSFGLVTMIFLFSYLGEKMHTESLVMYDKFCCVPWHGKSIPARKCLVIILAQAQKPFHLSFKSWTMGFTTFTQVINAAYSYFMLLKSME